MPEGPNFVTPEDTAPASPAESAQAEPKSPTSKQLEEALAKVPESPPLEAPSPEAPDDVAAAAAAPAAAAAAAAAPPAPEAAAPVASSTPPQSKTHKRPAAPSSADKEHPTEKARLASPAKPRPTPNRGRARPAAAPLSAEKPRQAKEPKTSGQNDMTDGDS